MSTYTPTAVKFSINSLKIVNCKEHKFYQNILLNLGTTISDWALYAALQILFVKRTCTAVHYQHNNKPH